MKKKFFLLVLMALTTLCAFAGSDIKVIDGNKKFLKKAAGEAHLTIDWSEATYDYQMPLADKFSDLQNYTDAAYRGFIESFNEECSKVQIAPSSQNAKYLFKIKVNNIDQYIKVFGFVPGPATKMWGTLEVIDLETQQTIVVISIKEVDGGASPSPYESFSDCFEELAEQVADLD